MASRNQCILLCKHCDFLEGSDCLRHKMTFSWCCCCFAKHFPSIYPQFRRSRKSDSHELVDVLNFVCEPACPSWLWLPKHSLVTQHEIYSLWA